MKIDRITYSESIEVSGNPGKWVKVGIEAEVLPDEHAGDCLDAARSFIKTWLLNAELPAITNPNWDHNTPVPVKQVEKESYDHRVNAMLSDISKCETIEELKTYRHVAAANVYADSVYKSKLEELSK